MYFHENFWETLANFEEIHQNYGKKWDHCEKLKNEKQKLLARTCSLVGNWWKKNQKIIIKKIKEVD